MGSAYTCKECRASFSSSSHLRRHELSQKLSRSHTCFFCERSFLRSDTARRHAETCPKRGSRPMPQLKKRGKPRRSCDSCAQAKSACNRCLPCSSCQANALTCTYTRLRIDPPSANPRSQRNYEDAGNTVAPSSTSQLPTDDLLKARVPFLLNYYSSGNSSSSFYRALESGRLRPSPDYASPAPSYESDATRLELFDEELLGDEGPLSNNLLHTVSLSKQASTRRRLALYRDRGKQMIQELRRVANKRSASTNGAALDSLNNAVSQGLFSVANIILFTELYFERLHRHCPILHPSYFRIESVSMPLLLAIFLSGSILSHPRDTFDLALGCFDLAEDFIFDSVSFHTNSNKNTTHHEISIAAESLIAAVNFINLQMGRNDISLRRKLYHHRFPVLICAAKSLRLSQLAHHDTGLDHPVNRLDWLSKECLIRTSTYLFLLEGQFCVCIGSFPSTPVDEFTGDLPCSELEFAKGQPASHISTNFSNTRSFSLKSSLDLLMSGDDPSCDNDIASLQGTSIFGFFTIIGGLLLSIRAAFNSRTIEHQRPRFERAMSRWIHIWDIVISESSADELAMVGFMSCAKEIWLVTQALLRLDLGEYLDGEGKSATPLGFLLQCFQDQRADADTH